MHLLIGMQSPILPFISCHKNIHHFTTNNNNSNSNKSGENVFISLESLCMGS